MSASEVNGYLDSQVAYESPISENTCSYIQNLEETICTLQKAILDAKHELDLQSGNSSFFNTNKHILSPLSLIFASLKKDAAVIQANIEGIVEKFTIRSDKRDSQLKELSDTFAGIEEFNDLLLFNYEELKKTKLQLETQVEELRDQLSASHTALQSLHSIKATLQKTELEVTALWDDQANLSRESNEKNDTIQTLQEEIEKQTSHVSALTSELVTLQKSKDELTASQKAVLTGKNASIETLTKANKTLNKASSRKDAELERVKNTYRLILTSSLVVGVALFALSQKTATS